METNHSDNKVADYIKSEQVIRSEKFIKASLILTSAIFTSLLLFNLLGLHQQHFITSNWVYISLLAISLMLLLAIRKGLYKFSAITLIFFTWAGMIFSIWDGRGTYDAANQAILVIILFAALLINRKAALVVAILSLANFWVIVIVTVHAQKAISIAPPLNMARDYTAIIITTIVIVLIYEKVMQNSIKKIAALLYQKDIDKEKISTTEASYYEIFEAIDDAIFLHDAQSGAIIDFNLSACAMFGFQKNELTKISINALSAVDEGFTQNIFNDKLQIAKTLGHCNFEWRSKRANGSTFWSDMHLKRSNIGENVRILAVVRDITLYKETNAIIRLNEEKYRTLVSNIPGAVYRCEVSDPWQTLYFSDEVQIISGYDKDDFLSGKLMFGELIHPDDRLRIDHLVNESIQQKQEYLLEYRMFHSDGSIRWILEKGRAKYDAENNAEWLDGVMFDISTQKQILEENSRISQLNSAILENAGYAIIATDTSGIINTFNKAAENMLGYTAAEMIGIQTPAVFHDGSEVVAQAQMLSVKLKKNVPIGFETFIAEAALNSPQEYEWTYIKKDGKRFPVLLKVTALCSHDAVITGYLGIAADITERKMYETTLLQSEERLKATLQFTPNVAIQWYDINGKVLFWNNASEKFYGYTSEEAVGKTLDHLLYTSDEFADFKNILTKIEKDSLPVGPFETVVSHKNGEHRTVLATTFSIEAQDDSKIFVCMDIDVTDKKEFEKKLTDERNLLRTLIDTLPVNVYVKDLNSKFVLANKYVANIMGRDQNELIGKNDFDFFPYEKAKEFFDDEQNLLTNSIPINSKEEHIIDANGERLIMITSKHQLFNSENEVIGLVGSGLNITDRVLIEEKIKSLNENLEKTISERTLQLQHANHDLEAFAYSVSHDLRAPLRHVDGFVRLLFSNISNPTTNIVNYYEKINIASKRMASMIDDLLNFSRLGRKELTLVPVDMQLLISEIIEQFKPDTELRNIDWKISKLPVISADKALIRIAFENLISNALKYSSKKEKTVIEIGCKHIDKQQIELFVKDNGVGFDMNYLPKLFGVFQRLHTNEEFEGTGIGLANVKQIISKHNGKIHAVAKENEGATFFISLKRL